MWRVIVGTLLALAALGAWSWFMFYAGGQLREQKLRRRGDAGVLGKAGVTLLKEANTTFNGLLNPMTAFEVGSYDMLSTGTAKTVRAWVQAYNLWRGKRL